MKNVFIFTAGLLVGSAVTYIATRNIFQKRLDDEVEEVREAYRQMKHGSEKVEETVEKEPTKEEIEKVKDLINYEKITSNYQGNKVNYSDVCARDKSKPYIIRPDEFDEMEDYDTISFMYYKENDILADENDDVVEDVEDTVGLDFSKHFGEFEDDSVYIRNDKYKIDYEILLSERNYEEDHPTYKPHEVEE